MKIINLNFIILILTFGLSFYQLNAQTTPQSCDCTVDLTGFPAYLNSLNLENEDEGASLQFRVPSNTATYAVLHGTINSTTPSVVQSFIDNYPNVNTLIFMQMPGSDDDVANLQAAVLLKNRGYTTYLPGVEAYPDDAYIASGAVDMFLSGTKRIIDVTAEVGVHAWNDGTNDATFYDDDSPEHQPYINYYTTMGFSQADAEAFYFFTINAAPGTSIHNMSEAEIEQYKLRTCVQATNPVYTATVESNTITANLTGATYQWLDCDNGNMPITGATERSFIPTNIGNYAVEVTEVNCVGTSNCYAVNDVVLALEEETEEEKLEEERKSLEIYPNPTSGILFIDARYRLRPYILYNQMGKSIVSGQRLPDSLDLSVYSKGVYYLHLLNDVIQIVKY